MSDPRVWLFEANCFGHDPEYGISTSRRSHLRYRWDIIWAGIFLFVAAGAGEIINIYATGTASIVGAVAFGLSTLWILGFLLDPIYISLCAYFRRKKMHAVK